MDLSFYFGFFVGDVKTFRLNYMSKGKWKKVRLGFVSMTKFRNYLQNIWSFGHEEHIMEVPFSNIDWLNRPPMIEEIASDNEEINNDQEPQVSDVIIFLKEIIMLADLQFHLTY